MSRLLINLQVKKKIKIFRAALKSIQNQYVGKPSEKLKFSFLVILHYFYKTVGIKKPVSFPESKFKLQNITLITRPDTIDFWACLESYEPDLTYFLIEILNNQKGSFIDIGGHIGRFTVLMAKNGWKTITFEPMESNYNSLIRNLEFNDCQKNTVVYNLGLGEENKTQTIYFDPREMGEASVMNTKQGSETQIKIVRFDDFMKDTEFEDFCMVKMDIEGNEERAINGMRNFLTEHKPLLVIELWKEHSKTLIPYLKSLGYKRLHIFWYIEQKHGGTIAEMRKLYENSGMKLNQEGELLN